MTPLPTFSSAESNDNQRVPSRGFDFLKTPAGQRIGLTVILIYFAINGIWAAHTHTPTVDEFIYLPAGLYHLQTRDFSLDPSNPPLIKMLAALPVQAMQPQLDHSADWRGTGSGWWPWIFATHFMRSNADRYASFFFWSRLVIVAIGLSGAVCLFFWTRTLFGPVTALGATGLYATLPPVLGHSSLATLDMGVTVLVFASFAALYQCCPGRFYVRYGMAGLLMGLAFTAKFVTMFFMPVIPVLMMIEWRRQPARSVQSLFLQLLTFGLMCLIGVTAGYLFAGFPMPASALDGIRNQIKQASAGEFPSFLLGEWSSVGRWHYYPVCLLFKMPIPFLILLTLGVAGLICRKENRRDAVWVLLPSALFLYVMAFHYQKNYGVRYLLPAIPFMVMAAGFGIRSLLDAGRWMRRILAGLIAWQVAGTTWAAPHHLAQFNELAHWVGQPRRLLLDSNLDWGQDLGRLKSYMDRHDIREIQLGYFGHVDPRLYGIEYTMASMSLAPGVYAISANYLAGYPYAITYWTNRVIPVPGDAWTWLDQFEPVDRVGQSIFIFRIEAGMLK